MKKLYIVIPVFNTDYNRLNTLIDSSKYKFDSFFDSLEYIIVDDCSDEKIELSGLIKANIKIITLDKNVGPGCARNEGLLWVYQNALDSDFIIFCDADDHFLKAFELSALKGTNCKLLSFGYMINNKTRGCSKDVYNISDFAVEPFFRIGSFIYNVGFFRGVYFEAYRIGEDTEFIFRLLAKAVDEKVWKHINKPVLYYNYDGKIHFSDVHPLEKSLNLIINNCSEDLKREFEVILELHLKRQIDLRFSNRTVGFNDFFSNFSFIRLVRYIIGKKGLVAVNYIRVKI